MLEVFGQRATDLHAQRTRLRRTVLVPAETTRSGSVMIPDLSIAIAAGIIVLFCAALILIDVVIEHRRAIDHDEHAEARRRDLYTATPRR